MEFNSGMLGVAIVVLGLIASCLFGVVINVNQQEVPKDTDSYVTDVTGLYATNSQDKAYLEYNPAKNYNGYFSETANAREEYSMQFQKTDVANSYPFYYYLDPVIHTYDAVTRGPTYYPDTLTPAIVFEGGYSIYYYSTLFDDWYPNRFVTVEGNTGYETGPAYGTYSKLMNLKNYLNTILPDDPLLRTVEMDFSYTVEDRTLNGNTTTNVHASDSAIAILKKTPNDSRYGFYQTDDGGAFYVTVPETKGKLDLYGWLDNPYAKDFFITSGTTVTFKILYDLSTGYITGTLNGNVIFAGEEPSKYIIAIQKGDVATGYSSQGTVTLSGNRNRSITVEENSQSLPRYLDPRYGVNVIPNSQDTVWENDYLNSQIDMIIAFENLSNTYETQFEMFLDTGVSNLLDVKHIGGGATILQMLHNGTTVGEHSIGENWKYLKVHIDSHSGEVVIQPIPTTAWTNFNTWTTDQEELPVGTFPDKGDITSIQISNDETEGAPFRFQISKTYVFLNTYGVIMIDPHMDIKKWYPNDTHFKIKYTKIASIGSEITIGGQTYIIKENEIGTYQQIDDEIKWVSTGVSLSEFSIEYDYRSSTQDYLITIASQKSGQSIEIISNNTEVSMVGAWYFTAGYYNVVTELVKEYTWDVGDGIVYGYTGVILFMMIFIGVIGFAWAKISPGALGALDIAILIGAEIILFIILA